MAAPGWVGSTPAPLRENRSAPERVRVGFTRPQKEDQMALARVVSFDGVSSERMAQMRQEMEGGERPDNIPASELIVLHDPESEKSLAIVFFDNEEDYAQGHAALDAMPASDTPGQRTSVTKYDVAVRMAD